MGAKIIYQLNEQIGEYGVKYVEDILNSKPRKAKFICPLCDNIFISTIDSVKRGHCKSCGCLQKTKAKDMCHKRKQKLIGKTFGNLTVIEEAQPRINKNGRIRNYWKCKCICNSFIEVETSNLTTGHTQSCGCIKSRGEEKIAKILSNNNIEFEREKYFTSYHDMRFDFYIPKGNYCIEYDEIQHFNNKNGNWNNKNLVEENQLRDDKKNKFCKENNIKLIRIPYTHFNNIELQDLLIETSSFICEVGKNEKKY